MATKQAESASYGPDIALQPLPPTADQQSLADHGTDPDEPPTLLDTPAIVYPEGVAFYFVALSMCLVLIVIGIDLNIISTAVPAITDHFHTVADVGWYSAAYRLMSCAFQFLFGKLYKLFPIKYVFLGCVLDFLLGSVVCAAASSSIMFVVGRALCGIGSAGAVAGCFGVVTYLVPPQKRPLWNANFALVETVASLSGPVLGGVLTQKLSWRWCFWICVPICAAALPPIIFGMKLSQKFEQKTTKEKISELDLLGTLFFVPSMTCLFVVLGWAGIKYPWSDPKVIGLLVTFAVLFALFVFDQYKKQDRAVLPPRIIKQRVVIAAFLFSVCCNSNLDIIAYYMPTYFQVVRGFSPAKSGYMMLPLIAGNVVGLLLFGSGTNIIGYYTPFMLTGSVLMPIAAGLLTTWRTSSSMVQVIAYSTFAGFAACIGIMAPQSAVQNALPPTDTPLGIAIILFAHNVGPALTLSISQTVFTGRLVADLKKAVPSANASSIEHMGLTNLRSAYQNSSLSNVLQGVDKALSQTWYIAVGLTCLSIVGSLSVGWRSIKQKRT